MDMFKETALSLHIWPASLNSCMPFFNKHFNLQYQNISISERRTLLIFLTLHKIGNLISTCDSLWYCSDAHRQCSSQQNQIYQHFPTTAAKAQWLKW